MVFPREQTGDLCVNLILGGFPATPTPQRRHGDRSLVATHATILFVATTE
ncbi:hypothetical protein [Brucella sp. NBRC 14130]